MPPANSTGYATWNEWSNPPEAGQHRHRDRWLMERAMSKLVDDDLWDGHCALCDGAVRFALTVPEDGEANFREEMTCPQCRLNARVRAGMHLAMEGLPEEATVYITEQASRPFVWLQRQRGLEVVGSEFTDDPERIRLLGRALNTELGGHGSIRYEDVTRLSMDPASFDAVVSFDVLEHVPDYRAALAEFARVLKPGGRLVLTAPFIAAHEDTIVRARLDGDGNVEHLLEPEYHGDPVAGGILCFYHFGWDLADAAREAGFSAAHMHLPWAPGLGYCGALWTLVATR
jgi:SAM-dependent methyltransferase